MEISEAIKVLSEISCRGCKSLGRDNVCMSKDIRCFVAKKMAIEALYEEPRKHGHWIFDSEGETVCSVCGKHTMDMQDEPFDDSFGKGWALKAPNYCSRCGAKMDEVSDGEK